MARNPVPADKRKLSQGNDPLAEAINQAATLQGGTLSPDEQESVFAVFRRILRDADEAGRRRLCEAVRHLAVLPQDIVLSLANDQPSVSLPFIAETPMLRDADLVKLVWSGDAVKQVTIAARAGLGSSVTSALAEVAGPRVILTLLANGSADISEASLQSCLARFPDDDGLHQKLIGRDRLPLSVSEALLERTTPVLQQTLLSRHAVSPAVAQEVQRRRGSAAPWWRMQIFSR
ncbi:DUF2336 domain-containing protein [Pelagibius litoralis]|uniref:DUF2336 domain-containing protein n=1 Tax=Pelagibius litoralis TaxID=374515 RepID=A0A967CBB8_9PROT|nr:DUF2336 domain-containing protein [Pelagibius litoralis]NIA68084.1 DUF2336 domain-containing protein [Pelagibius litoralis]